VTAPHIASRSTLVAAITAAIAVTTTALVLLSVPVLSVVAGLALAFVLPGYALTLALFTGRQLARLERIVLTPALSLAVLVIGGLLLYVARIQLTMPAWALLAGGVTVAAAAVTYVRVRAGYVDTPGGAGSVVAQEMPAPVVPSAPVVSSAPGVSSASGVSSPRQRAMSSDSTASSDSTGRRRMVVRWVAPALAALLLLGGASWISLHSAAQQRSSVAVTELSILPTAGAPDLSSQRVSIAIDNQDASGGNYRLVLRGPDGYRASFAPGLGRDGNWHYKIDVPIGGRVVADLFRDGAPTPYRSVSLDLS
jgi:Protein of unknown function (DUF1616)